jgi:hypothetical protein
MSASQSGVYSLQEFTDAGVLLVAGRLYTYTSGTTTFKTAYTDAAGLVPQTYTSDGIGGQYIALNARGELPAPLYLAAGSYDLTLKRADGSTVWTRQADPTSDAAAAVSTAFTASGGAALVGYGSTNVAAALNAFTLVATAASLQAAVSAAFAASTILYASGSVAATGNVTNLHEVYKFGAWAITRGGNTWYTQPTNSQTNTVFVATTGNDTNDGLTAALPVATLARALAIIASYGPALSQGTWIVSLAAGTYSQGSIDFPVCLANRNRVQITGPTVATPGVPTVIFDGGGTQPYGLNFNSRALASVSYIKFQNYTTFGVVGQDLGDILTNNVHVANVPGGPGIKVQQGRLRVQGGIISACQTGINCIGGSTFTIGDPASASLANGTQILNCTQQGILAQEQSSGHADFCTITNCAVGLDATVHSRFHAQACVITANATAGVRCTDSSSWFDNGTSANFATNTVNELIYNAEGEIGRDGNRTVWQRQPSDQIAVINTGSTTANIVKTYASAIATNSFNTSVKGYRMEILATNNGVAGTKTVSVQIGGTTVCTFIVPAAALTFNLDLMVTARNSTSQRVRARAWADATYIGTVVTSSAISVLTGAPLPATITVQNASAADQFQIIEVEQLNAGGC